MGSSIFTDNYNYSARTVGQAIQVGPTGPLNATRPPYGTISSISGSGDLVPPMFLDTSGFVWGLSGILKRQSSGPLKQQSHYYEGDCYLGYVKGAYNFDYQNPLLHGSFSLTWTYIDGTTAQINGEARFDAGANPAIPPLWGYPFMFGQINQHIVVTSDVGFFMIKANKTYCTTGVCDNAVASSSGHSSGVNTEGLIVGLVVAGVVVVVVVLGTAGFLWHKRRRETEQEDGIFAVARKPEYGSALVVDDIIEETKGNKNLRSMLNRNKHSDDEESNEEGEEDDSDRSRSRSRSRSEKASDRSPSRSGSSRSSSINSDKRRSSKHTADDDSDPGESASRAEESYDE